MARGRISRLPLTPEPDGIWVSWDVWAGKSPTNAQGGINSGSNHKGAAMALYTRYANQADVPYVEIRERRWTEKPTCMCCGCTITTLKVRDNRPL